MNLPSWLTAEQKQDIQQSLRDQRLRKQGNYYREMDLKHYGSPEPKPVTPKAVVFNYADSQEVRAVQNHHDNEITGLKKMAHSHSKGSKKQKDAF